MDAMKIIAAYRRFRNAVTPNWRIENVSAQPGLKQSPAALPRNLKRLREARGWSVAQLSTASGGISHTTIRELERPVAWGASRIVPNPRLNTLMCLARALGVGIEALVEEGEGR